MPLKAKRWRRRDAGRAALSGLALAGLLFAPGCALLHRHRTDLSGPFNPGDQPDKILYERAVNEIRHSRFDVGRLTLQTLLNTYPDSEYLSKAKLAIADSYYNEGGVSGLTQSEAEYKDFITFFPTAPEAPMAQFRAGMAHFRLMGKADRDLTEAKLAEAEFKEFLLKYPDSDLLPRVKRRLRETQEVLASGEYEIANFYYMRHADRAAESRFRDIAENYPNYSQADSACWYLGQTLERLKKPSDAVPYYARVLTDYPLSPEVGEAKRRLVALHQPIPRPTKAMLARAAADRTHLVHPGLFERLTGMMSSAPDTSMTRRGPVEIGGPGKTQVAVKPVETPTGTGGTGVMVAPVSESSLESRQPATEKSTEKSGGQSTPESKTGGEGRPAADKTATASTGTADPAPAQSSTAPTAKKKSKKGLWKKIIKPF
jgi:outer membrane protein assembly factor BamD